MTLQQFQVLNQHHQFHHLLLDGTCIAERTTEEVQVLLFQLGSFYVEVFFTPDCEEVFDTRSFDDTEELQPYLATINLDRPWLTSGG